MAIDLVTGHTGSNHISSGDVGRLLSGVVGPDAYVLGKAPTLTVADANHVVVGACDLVVQGRHVRLTGGDSVTIESGVPGAYRHDLVCITYSVSETVESMALTVVRGTPAQSAVLAADPTVPSGAIGIGATVSVPVARVSVDGLTPAATWLLGTTPTLATLGGTALAVHNIYGMWTGTKNGVTNGIGELVVMERADIVRIAGSGFDWQRDWFGVMSGHRDNGITVTMGSQYQSNSGQLVVSCVDPAHNGVTLRNTWVLVNWLLVKGA